MRDSNGRKAKISERSFAWIVQSFQLGRSGGVIWERDSEVLIFDHAINITEIQTVYRARTVACGPLIILLSIKLKY